MNIPDFSKIGELFYKYKTYVGILLAVCLIGSMIGGLCCIIMGSFSAKIFWGAIGITLCVLLGISVFILIILFISYCFSDPPRWKERETFMEWMKREFND